MSTSPFRVAVLASGTGSNFAALAARLEQCGGSMLIAGVVSDRADAPVLSRAVARGLSTRVIPYLGKVRRPEWDESLGTATAELRPDLVVLAGFMRILGPGFLHRFTHRVVNVHPSLLPAFPGMHAPRDALTAGARITGCTVHLVDEGVDTGPILAQAAVPIVPGDTEENLHRRIQTIEHLLLPATVVAIAEGKIELGAPPRFTTSDSVEMSALVSPSFLLTE